MGELVQIAKHYNDANPLFGGSIKSHHKNNISLCLDQQLPKRGTTIRLTVDHLKVCRFANDVDNYGYLLVYRWELPIKIL